MKMTNITENVTATTTNPRTHLTIIIQVVFIAILGVIIVIGNLAIIIIFIKTQSLRKRCFNLIISLSIADFLVGVADFMDVYYFYTPETVERKFLKSLGFVGILSGNASILTLASISVERFLAIVFPYRYRQLGRSVYFVFIALPWMISLVISSFYYFEVFCSIYRYIRVVFPIIAVLVILFVYTGIGIKIRLNKMNTENQNRRKRNQKLVMTLLLITFASLVCWLPLQLFQSLRYFCSSCPNAHINVFYLMIFLQCCNSGINVFVYILRMPEFRLACFAMLCPKRERSRTAQREVIILSGNRGFEDDEASHGTREENVLDASDRDGKTESKRLDHVVRGKNTTSGNDPITSSNDQPSLQNFKINVIMPLEVITKEA